MTIDEMKGRLLELRQKRDKFVNTAFVLDGHIEELEYWIKKESAAAPQVPPKAPEAEKSAGGNPT